MSDRKRIVVPAEVKALPSDDIGLEWELKYKAKWSSPALDRGNDITLPTAFEANIAEFWDNPVMMFNHDPGNTIGKWISGEFPDTGPEFVGLIAPTQRGKEVATLIRYGVVKQMSFTYEIMDWEPGQNGAPNIIKEVKLYEIGPVSIAMNPDTWIELVEKARKEGIELSKSLWAGDNNEERSMNLEEIQKTVDSSLTPIKGDVEKHGTKISEVQGKVDNLATLTAEIKDAVNNGNKTSGELRELVDKVAGEFKAANDELTKEIEKVKKRKEISAGLTMPNMDHKSLLALGSEEVKALWGGSDTANRVNRLQKLNDDVLMLDTALQASSKNGNGEYHRLPRNERLKSLSLYREFDEFRKAMDTSTASEGTEWVPTNFSAQMEELMRLELKVASLFPRINMPTKSYTLPIDGADTTATLISEKTTVISAFDSTEQTPGTGNQTLTAIKARSRIQVSAEETEDSIIPVLPYIRTNAARGIARFIDYAIVSGQSTADIDSGYTIGSTDPREAWDGLRYHYQNSVTSTYGVDLSTFSEDNLRKVRGNMDLYGLYPDDLVILTSVKTYLMKFLRDLDSVLTVDKYGPNAVIHSGELAKFDATPIILSPFCADNLNADGIYDGTTTDRSEVLYVNPSMWVLGDRRKLSVEMVRDAINDVYTIVAFWRGDFKPLVTPSSTYRTVNSGYNVTF